MVNLVDIRETLRAELAGATDVPCHLGAFCSWVNADNDMLRQYVDQAITFTGQMRRPDHIAALGYGAASGLLTPDEKRIFCDDAERLSGRAFFAAGRPLRFEIDGIALVGVSLGLRELTSGSERKWLIDVLERSAKELDGDPWQSGLVRSAKSAMGATGYRIMPPDLAVAMADKGIGEHDADELAAAWDITVRLEPHNSGLARDAVRLAVFEYVLACKGQIALTGPSRSDLVSLLENVSRSMRLWTFETKNRTPKSAITKWNIENEYHVQNLLWAVLAPVFPGLEDEENLPSIGHKNPRADLGIPSLKTIIEVKFMRNAGQAACAKIIEEIAADAVLYLSKTTTYDNIIAFIWDDCSQTEQHHELKTGLQELRGVTAAIILPRPSKMQL